MVDFSAIEQLLIRNYIFIRYLRKYINKMGQFQGCFKDIVLFMVPYGSNGPLTLYRRN
jgi:hypothetical protein